ncbi:MAG: hypothetical protein A2V66_04505 [Ignavibacteria bacterium RBG_13_36_8]|nr:MAG: hypothetical protein A2V66_04505 [Ignavibacteria bacterium RBG_13_36_8]
MNKIIPLALFILFVGLLLLNEQTVQYSPKPIVLTDVYENGFLKKEISNVRNTADYDISIELLTDSKYIIVSEDITWINRTEYSTNEIQFHLYANGYKSNKTLFAQQFNVTPEYKTELEIEKLLVDDKEKELIYFQPEVENPHDSTVSKVILSKTIEPGDSVKIHFDYKMKIPRSIKRLGYAAGRNFFFISQWFPKVGVFEEGRWVCSQYHPYTNFYSDFGEYTVKIKVPKEYVVAATGIQHDKLEEGESSIYLFKQTGVHDFAWCASDEILSRQEIYTRNDGTGILIQAYVQPEREKFFERYINAVKNSLEFFERNIGVYPYQTITLVDVPRTSASGGMEYPTLLTTHADLFSPDEAKDIEMVTVHEFAHQYFYGMVANNEVYEAWLDEGIATYLTEKIMQEYYGERNISFRIAKYFPIYGLNLLSYNEIPLIYTLGIFKDKEGSQALAAFYRSPSLGAIADTSYQLPNLLSYVINSYYKPQLMLMSLERYVGYDKMMNILSRFFEKYKYRHPKSKDFIRLVENNTEEDLSWFFDNVFEKQYYFDYRVNYVQQVGDNEYEVFVERLGGGSFKSDVALYTENDTLVQTWDGIERWKKLIFKTADEVIGAEIDPDRQNVFDINYSNNSYTVESRYWASLSLAIRVFFWIQSALLLFGSIG